MGVDDDGEPTDNFLDTEAEDVGPPPCEEATWWVTDVDPIREAQWDADASRRALEVSGLAHIPKSGFEEDALASVDEETSPEDDAAISGTKISLPVCDGAANESERLFDLLTLEVFRWYV